MGQGYSLTTPSAGSAGIDVPELGDLVYERSLGNARFMKSIRARHHHDGVVLVKVLVKPYTPMALGMYRERIVRERRLLADVPNVLAMQRIVETETNGYLVRQFLYNSLYDRLSTRPFLEDIEKKWLAFQLLCAVRDAHARDVFHGDIKTENVLVTSWNWLYLTDFSGAFKPVLLPDDNPADFSYFFDTSGRRTCYLAPERFVPAAVAATAAAAAAAARTTGDSSDNDDDGDDDEESRSSVRPDRPPKRVTAAMDVFSAGCVIAELVLEAPIFSLSQVFRYRRNEYDPDLSRIPNRALADMIAHMIQLDPQKRYGAEEYLTAFRGSVFPEYFYSFLHQYMELIMDPASGQHPVSGASRNLGEPDERIDRVYYDFDKIAYFLGFQEGVPSSPSAGTSPPPEDLATRVSGSRLPTPPRLGLELFPVRLNIPNKEHVVLADAQPTADDGVLIFLTLIVASMRNTARAASKIRACDILLAFAERLTDEAKLDRVLPYLMALLTDRADMVVVAAVRSITQLLALVHTVSPVNAHVFLEYILPRMQTALLGGAASVFVGSGSGGGGGSSGRGSRREASALVRATYAACLGTLAATANRFLEMAARVDQLVAANDDADLEAGSGGAVGRGADGRGGEDALLLQGLFDTAQRDLMVLFEQHTMALIEDPDPFVRRAFLTSVPELCLFFGPDANEVIVAHLNTYLNDRDWMLKCAFFDTIVSVATFLGSVSLEEFILPLMVQALTDPEEHVVQAVLQVLASLADVGLFSKPMLWELVGVVARFAVHPNLWIRTATARFLAAATKFLSPAQVYCIFMPLVVPFLTPGMSVLECSELDFLDHLQKPLSRAVFNQAVVWAMKAERGIFWKPVQSLRGFPFGMGSTGRGIGDGGGGSGGSGNGRVLVSGRESIADTLLSRSTAHNDEDELWITRLRNLGLEPDDEFKLLALREYIWRLSRLKLHEINAAAQNEAVETAAAAAVATRASDNGGHGHSVHSTPYGGTQSKTMPNFSNIVQLRSLGITPQNIIFDEEPQMQTSAQVHVPPLRATDGSDGGDGGGSGGSGVGTAPRTIEDALHDAFMTIDGPIERRRRAALNVHKARVGSRNRGTNASSSSPSPSPAVRAGVSTPATVAEGEMAVGRVSPPLDGGSSSGSGSGKNTPNKTSLRHRPSAMSLLNRKDSVKSGAATGTTEANAFGQVEGRSALNGSLVSRSPGPSTTDDLDSTTASDPEGGPSRYVPSSALGATVAAATQYRAHHNYTGNDPSVLKMLDAMFVENYPHDLAEFSPMVTPISRRRTTVATGSSANGGSGGSSGYMDASWRPSGQLVATFSEHTGPINRVVVAPDHAFFVTGGDDGTVRVWDTARQERNLSHRSRQVHRHAAGARVLALCFIENTHCVVSCASDGSVHVIKVEYVTGSSGGGGGGGGAGGSGGSDGTLPRYGRLRLLREYHLPKATKTGDGVGDEWAVWCEHYKQEASSVLVLATNQARVLGIDLRTMTLLYVLRNPVQHGTPTCFAVDRKRNWLVLATSHGVLDLWDLRFHMRLKGWGVPGGAPIYRLAIHPSRGRGRWLCVAGGTGHGEVTVWDLEKTLCREVYRTAGGGTVPTSAAAATAVALKNAYEPWDVDEDGPEGMLRRFATSIDTGTENPAGPAPALAGSSAGDKGVRALVVGSAPPVDEQHRDVRYAFLVTGGSDRKLRFWDLARVENSAVYSGQRPDEARPTYVATQVTTAMAVNLERLARPGGGGAEAGASGGNPAKGRWDPQSQRSQQGGAGTSGNKAASRPSRASVIALEQQMLLRSHLDAILDAALLESPYMATVSVDRMGVIFVFS